MNFYDRQGRPLTLMEWAALVEDRDGAEALRRVAQDAVTLPDGRTVWVSTVWLGIDHGLGMDPGPPLIFETMIFGRDRSPLGPDLGCWRWSTEAEAEAGHVVVVVGLRTGDLTPDEP